jgi:hypothetical protein
MEILGYIFGILGYLVALACWRELKKTKKILAKYVNDEDKKLLLTKANANSKKRQYMAFGLWLFIFIIGVTIIILKQRK